MDTHAPSARLSAGPRLGGLARAAGLLALAAVGAWLVFALLVVRQCARDGCYEGRPLSRWARDLQHPSGQWRAEAARALAEIGPAAVPVLIDALRDPKLRRSAVYALGDIGPGGHRAAPALAEVLRNSSRSSPVAEDAARALGRMGPAARDAVPTLVATVRLSALDLETRRWAVRALGAIGRGAGRATPALVEALDGPLAHDAAFALMAVAPDTARATPAAVEIFRRALHDQSLDVQRAAVMALGISGPVAPDALPDLRALITEHPDGKLRDLASRAITLIESR